MAKASVSLRGERVGLFSMDPGTTTGITWSNPLLEGTTKEIFERDPITVDQVDCTDEKEGAKVIAETFRDCYSTWNMEMSIPVTNIFFVYEDFVLYPGKTHSSERTGLSPVRITSLVEGMLIQDQVTWVAQMASLAKSTVTNDRLKKWGLWTRSMEHGRDATRHAALWVRRQVS